MTETYSVRWVVDPGHGWLEVELDEALEAARAVRPISACSYVDLDRGLAYLEEDCDAGIWLEWVAGSSDDDAVRAVALGVEGFHHCDGLAWVRGLESWSWFDRDGVL
jgi:hypothetical protein